MTITETNCNDDSSTSSCSSDLAFANLDMTGVNFDCNNDDNGNEKEMEMEMDETDVMKWIDFERQALFYNAHQIPIQCVEQFEGLSRLTNLSKYLDEGRYIDILRSEISSNIFGQNDDIYIGNDVLSNDDNSNTIISSLIRQRLASYCNTLERCIEAEMVGVAALNLFLQLNYTGPFLDSNLDSTVEPTTKDSQIIDINPHPIFKSHLCTIDAVNTSASGGDALKETCNNHNKTDSNKESENNEKGISKNDEHNGIQPKNEKSQYQQQYHNKVLSYLCVDGEWPCQVCETPYFLLIARIILSTLADPLRLDWSNSLDSKEYSPLDETQTEALTLSNNLSTSCENNIDMPKTFIIHSSKLQMVSIWSARAALAHQRLLQCQEPSHTLWKEVNDMFQKCIRLFCYPIVSKDENDNNLEEALVDNNSDDEITQKFKNYHSRQGIAARVMLEFGLAQYHFNKERLSKSSFQIARDYSGVQIEVIGAQGKRTKFQQESKAQMLVRASSIAPKAEKKEKQKQKEKEKEKENNANQNDEMSLSSSDEEKKKIENIKANEVQHAEDEILLDRIKYEEDEFNVSRGSLEQLDQAILLAFCLDVKNNNPMDGLTAEQMGGYLERVLIEHDDWMIYSTGLLERAWLECERVHGRERAILQIQALADQHTNRLTLTQSTYKSVEDSAPVQDRLRNLHCIVYPPRWEIMRDLGERYAKLGIVTTAAEIFEEIELWDEVVECYTHAGKASKAEEVVRKRLSIMETPRMWVALGDLTGDSSYYQNAIRISNGRYATAFTAMGRLLFNKNDLRKASEYLQKGLRIKPLLPQIWFLVGTISMRIEDWDTALRAFSEVVQQEPEEGDAWSNIAAIHIRNRNPSKAYTAIIEVSLIHTVNSIQKQCEH